MRLQELDVLGKHYRIYAEVLENDAIRQFVAAMKLDCVVSGALMPDAHTGYTLPIGAVVAVKDMVFPSYVGYDIGCGMCAVPTTFDAASVKKNAKAIFDAIYETVPVGFRHNDKAVQWAYKEGSLSNFAIKEILSAGNALKQLGTLGGGNHFIEIGEDETHRIWIIIHSGSRNVGQKIASHYMKDASGDGKAREGHFGLHVDSQVGQDYIADLKFGLAFALENRLQMIRRVEKAMRSRLKGVCEMDSLINRNHNHADQKDGVWIHRKGATHAEAGMMGVIPGNMRDGSFIVRGKGNPEALWSSSHGAGRVLGRKNAKQSLSMESFIETMRGVTARVEQSTLDESPFAYKDIFSVMDRQRDMVERVAHVRPIINIKG